MRSKINSGIRTTMGFVLIMILCCLLAPREAEAQKMKDYPILKELKEMGFDLRNIVEVSTMKEFISALDNNTVILVKDGEYYFTDSNILGDEEEKSKLDNFDVLSEHYTDTYIHDLHDIAILSKGDEMPSFLQPDGYNHVMKFRNVENLFMQNLHLGHEVAGYCMGGVLMIYNGENIRLDNLELTGSGTEGLSMIDIDSLLITNSLITESSEQLSTFSNVHNATLDGCSYKKNNVTLRGFTVYYSELTFKDCYIKEKYEFYPYPESYASDYDVLFVIDDYDFAEWYINRGDDPVPEGTEPSLIIFENTRINDEVINLTYDLGSSPEYEEGEEWYEEDYDEFPEQDSIYY